MRFKHCENGHGTRWGRYERLRPRQIESILAESPVAYVPWGALEWHSYHNPIGLDSLKALGLCTAMAQQTGGVVLPPIYAGTDTIKPFKGFKHTLNHSAEVVRLLAAEILEQLVDEGFKVIIVLTGHYGQGHVQVLSEVAEVFQRRFPGTGLWVFPDYEILQGDFEPNHAALGETSFQLLFDPTLVDLSQLPKDRVTALDTDGVAGEDPRNASQETGEHMLSLFLKRTVPRIKTMVEAARH